jgi:hypothetical protein
MSPEKQEAVFAAVNQPCIPEAPRRRKPKNGKLSSDGPSSMGGCPITQEERSVNGKSRQQVRSRSCKEISKETVGEFLLAPVVSSWYF